MNKEETKDSKQIRSLILQVRNTDQSAFSELLRLYSPLLNATVKKYACDPSLLPDDAEDLRQETLLFFYNAIMTYNLDQDRVNFGLYAKICITNGLISHLRSNRRAHPTDLLPYDTKNEIAQEDFHLDAVAEEERVRELYSLIESHLSDYENKVWRLYISGYSSKVISEVLLKSEKSIDNAIFRIRCKLKKLLHR